MKTSLKRYGLLSAVLLATAAPVLALPMIEPTQVQMSQPHGQEAHKGPQDGAQGARGGQHEAGPRFHAPRFHAPRAPHHRPAGPEMPGLELAGKLAAAETFVGITNDQEDAWRDYTSALIDFVSPPAMPGHGPDGERGPDDRAPDIQADDSETGDVPPSIFDALADGALERGEKAQLLKDALANLTSTLDADQLDRLRQAEHSFMPGPGRDGPPPRHGRHDAPGFEREGHGGRPGPERQGPGHEMPAPDEMPVNGQD